MNCPRNNCKNKAIQDITLGVLPCQSCQDKDEGMDKYTAPEFYSMTQIHRIQSERDKHNGDIEQPYLPGKDMKPNPNFLKLYPDRARDYFSEEQLKKI